MSVEVCVMPDGWTGLVEAETVRRYSSLESLIMGGADPSALWVYDGSRWKLVNRHYIIWAHEMNIKPPPERKP